MRVCVYATPHTASLQKCFFLRMGGERKHNAYGKGESKRLIYTMQI